MDATVGIAIFCAVDNSLFLLFLFRNEAIAIPDAYSLIIPVLVVVAVFLFLSLLYAPIILI